MKNIRYQKHYKLNGFGEEGQKKLAEGKILIIGAGGLGTPAAQYLNSIGVGTIGIIDGDLIELSNLPRQTLYSPDDVGKHKTEILIRQLQKQNPETRLISHLEFLIIENALSVISEYDLVIDASDNFGTRYLANDACVILKKPLIYGAIHEFEGQVCVLNYQNGPTYRCLFPESDQPQFITNCDENGVLGILPGLIGTYQAIEALKVLTEIGEPLTGKLLIVDTLAQSHLKVAFPVQPQNQNISSLQSNYGQSVCNSISIEPLEASTLQNWINDQKPFEIIDVRSVEEFGLYSLEGSKNIPLQQLESYQDEITGKYPIILVCQSGKRSSAAAQILNKITSNLQIFNLSGGLNSFQLIR